MTHPTGPPDVDVEEVKRSLARRAEYNNGRLARDALAVIKALEKDSKESLDLYRNNRTRLEARIAALEEAARRVLDEMDICLDPLMAGHPIQAERERDTVARWREWIRQALAGGGSRDG